mmetsp:Transcript_124999/g.233834  ORF Transcript_124999/g.233834 Transcript_124999/m.233834 type:complete len:370 (-) Transcript_124999:56-1165(-)
MPSQGVGPGHLPRGGSRVQSAGKRIKEAWTCRLAVSQATYRAPDRIRPGKQLPDGIATELWNSAHRQKQSAAARASELWMSSDSTVLSAATFSASTRSGFDMLEALQSEAWVPAPTHPQSGSRPRTPLASRLREPAAGDELASTTLPMPPSSQPAQDRPAVRAGAGKLAMIAWDVEQAAREEARADAAVEAESAAALVAASAPRAPRPPQRQKPRQVKRFLENAGCQGCLNDSCKTCNPEPTSCQGCLNDSCKTCNPAPEKCQGCLNDACKTCRPARSRTTDKLEQQNAATFTPGAEGSLNASPRNKRCGPAGWRMREKSQRSRASVQARAAPAEVAAQMQAKVRCSRCRVRPCSAHKRFSHMSVDTRK